MTEGRDLQPDYLRVREQSLALCRGLTEGDMTAQSMPDASPTKWHLAHTTWFFETFILMEQPGYRPFNPHFQHLFNSYYNALGHPYLRPDRGLLTRPSVDEVFAYRCSVDEALINLLEQKERDIAPLVTLGLHHEMQHQELMQTDLLHLLSHNPMAPAPFAAQDGPAQEQAHPPLEWHSYEGGLHIVGAPEQGFSYDCERPQHRVFLTPFKLASRPVTNAEWQEFIDDNGYDNAMLWLSDGWAECRKQGWQAPAYWQKREGRWHQYGLDGLQPVNPAAPVSHISYYEAQAFARWAGKRLPREHELEFVSAGLPIAGNFLEQQRWRPGPADDSTGLQQLYGDVWEWTQSAYLPYPGFSAENGALGEYNGKFMCNQLVLRGGSCATPARQMRASYRNFFYPHQRWQYTGLRLASDCPE